MTIRMLQSQAVVDTSFWSICCHLSMADKIPQVWFVPALMPGVVVGEVFAAPSPGGPLPYFALLFPDQLGFLQAFVHGHLKADNPSQNHTTALHLGERAVIDLALEILAQGSTATVLINEKKAHRFAKSQGLDAVSVPEFLVILLKQGILRRRRLSSHGSTGRNTTGIHRLCARRN